MSNQKVGPGSCSPILAFKECQFNRNNLTPPLMGFRLVVLRNERLWTANSCLKANHECVGIWKWGLLERYQSMRVEPAWTGLVPFWEETWERWSLSLHQPCEDTVRRWITSKQEVAWPNTGPEGSLTMNFQVFRTVRNWYLSHTVCGFCHSRPNGLSQMESHCS